MQAYTYMTNISNIHTYLITYTHRPGNLFPFSLLLYIVELSNLSLQLTHQCRQLCNQTVYTKIKIILYICMFVVHIA